MFSSTPLAILILPIGVLIAAATGTSSPPPDLTGIAAVITAGIGLIGFVATLWRGRKNNQRVSEIEDAASYVKGFDTLTKRLREEIDDLEEKMEKLEGSQNEERERWFQERNQMQETISNLGLELKEQVINTGTTQAQLSELRGQIRGFLNAKQYNEFQKHIH